MSQQQFDGFSVRIRCEKDRTTGKPIDMSFNQADFTEVKDQESSDLFQFCAMSLPDLTAEQSIKYQVLSDSTAMIGVIKQKNDENGELRKIDTIQFGNGVITNLKSPKVDDS